MILSIILAFHCWLVQPDYCQIYGNMHEVEFPEQADFFVYEETSEAFSDILIYEQENRLYADKPGMWYWEEEADFADYRVYFVEDQDQAHFTVYFTNFESFAGCNQ
jgi:hypothetical protein